MSPSTAALREFAPQVRAELERLLGGRQPIFTGNAQSATDQELKTLQAEMRGVLDRYEAAIATRNAVIDSDYNYDAIGDLCANWNPGAAKPQQPR